MKCISVRQPWAWLIIHGGKDIENRDWTTNMRGRVLVHASKGVSTEDIESATSIVADMPDVDRLLAGIRSACLDAGQRGGIIGSVEIVDCVLSSPSPWFFGRFGFVLRAPIALPFRPFKGALGFFDVPEET